LTWYELTAVQFDLYPDGVFPDDISFPFILWGDVTAAALLQCVYILSLLLHGIGWFLS